MFKLSSAELNEIEHLVVQRFENFLYHDLSVVVYSLVQLDYSPKTLLNLVNRMNQMSNFNKEQCVRMLEALVNDPDTE